VQIKYSAFKETFNANIIQQNLHYWVEALQIKNRFSRKSVTFQMSNKRTNATTCILRHTVHVLEAKILNTWVSNCSLLFYCVRSSITDDLNNNATCLVLLKWLFVVWNTAVHYAITEWNNHFHWRMKFFLRTKITLLFMRHVLVSLEGYPQKGLLVTFFKLQLSRS
jgi:hypothetical protein